MDILGIISASMQAGAETAMIRAGLRNPLVSQRNAEKTYGVIFAELLKAGKIHPVKVGEGRKGTRWYSVEEILALIVAETAKADIIWKD